MSCDNFAPTNSSGSCSCPPGFGGATCSQPACGGNIFQGAQRPLASNTSSILTSDCDCQSGWTGTGCNVCSSTSACQAAIDVSSSGSSSSSSPDDLSGIQNNTLTCNTTPRVYSSSQISCAVINPTLQSLYPGSSNLNIMRTLDPSLTPVPDVAAWGTNGTAFASLFYDGIEQFFCQADSCIQHANSSNTAFQDGVDWECQNLQCKCKPGTDFCGAVPATDLTQTIDSLSGVLGIDCSQPDPSTGQAKCNFRQDTLNSLFGSSGLAMDGCVFGECVRQSVIDSSQPIVDSDDEGSALNGGVIAGLAVVGGLIFLALALLGWGLFRRRAAKRASPDPRKGGGVGIKWTNVSYVVPGARTGLFGRHRDSDKVILDDISGEVQPGQFMAILGPSGAGKTTFVEKVLSLRSQATPKLSGSVTFPCSDGSPIQIGFVPQQDVLPPTLTVFEALMFAASSRLPEHVSVTEKRTRVEDMLEILGISHLRDSRIGGTAVQGNKGTKGGISGGEMRRVSIGLELIAAPDVLILDEPTSGLDSVSALRVAKVLQAIAHDPERPTAVIASIHQPSSQLYQVFDTINVLSKGRAVYTGPGGFAPVQAFALNAEIPKMLDGYNVADYLLEIASDPALAAIASSSTPNRGQTQGHSDVSVSTANENNMSEKPTNTHSTSQHPEPKSSHDKPILQRGYATTFLTQFIVLCGREWKILRRDKTLFLAHIIVACVLGVFCGGLYYQTDLSIAGFQSRVGCLFFLGALIAFSSLSALYNIVEIRPLFLRERSSRYYSPTAWLLSRVVFDVIPLRIVPTILVSTITYWMAGLAHDAANFFKFLLILVLYTLAMTLFNFLLGTFFTNGGIAILLSALTALYQMTYAGFFVHLNSIPPVLRWLQWFCPLKFTLEALSVNEVGSGLMIIDTLEGVPVNVSATLIMELLFGFTPNAYYRDVLVLFAFIAGFGVMVIGIVWAKVKER